MSVNDSKKHQLILKTPASWWGNMWREALPSGNGIIGAAIYGGIQDETILFNHAELWHGEKRDVVPDVSDTLPVVRQLIDESRFQEANGILTEAVLEKGYDTRMAKPLPLGDLTIKMSSQNGFRRYRRMLDMESGEVAVSWEDGAVRYERLLFVSRADDMAVYELRGNGGTVDADFRFDLHDERSEHPIVLQLKPSFESKAVGDNIFYAVQNSDNSDFGAVLRIIPEGGEMQAINGSIRVKNADSVLVLVKIFVKGERSREWPALQQQLSRIDDGYNTLLKRHLEIHKPLFQTASISLGVSNKEARSNEDLLMEAYEGDTPDELIEKLWAYGRYMFISGTSSHGQPLAMYGLWGGDYDAIWAYHMANENIQMMYWHATKGGLVELMPALFDYYDSMLSDFQDNAKKLYGCRGIYVPAGSSPGLGIPALVVPIIMNWTAGAGWLARHYYEYYQYTGDIEFLKRRALPFMKEAALFYEDFLVEGSDGTYRFYPSVSPENSPSNLLVENYDKMGHPSPTTINATMDVAIAKELLQHLIEGSRIAGLYNEEIGKWERMLAKIPPYEINEDGAIKEWLHPDLKDNYNHRHQSHLYPVFPGEEISRDSHPELFRAFETAVKKRLVVGLSDQSGWSLMHMANTYARLGDGDHALECLELLSRSCVMSNFYMLHNDWRNMGICLPLPEAVFQTDANMGFVSAVQEMLIYISQHIVRLLPACPQKWDRGQATDFRFCTGRVTMEWDVKAGKFEAMLLADRNTELTLYLPDYFGSYQWEVVEGVIEPLNDRADQIRVQLNPGGMLKLFAN